MAKFKNFQQWQKDFIKENEGKFTFQELSDHLKITVSSLFNYCTDNNIRTKNSHKKTTDRENHQAKIIRPSSTYTQISSPLGIASSMKI